MKHATRLQSARPLMAPFPGARKLRRLALLAVAAFVFVPATLSAQAATRYWDPVFPQVDETPDIEYGSAVNFYTKQTEKLKLDLYQPRGDTETARPAVVIAHGGYWVFGNSKDPIQMVHFARDFARRGYVAVSINYRKGPSISEIQKRLYAAANDSQQDAKAAVRWLRRHAKTYRIDPDRIAAIGESAGAFAVALASYFKDEGNSGNPGYSSKIQAVVDLWGGVSDRPMDLAEIESGETPCMIVHGDQDKIAPFSLATLLEARCKTVGVPVKLYRLAGRGHRPWDLYGNILTWSLGWYYRHLKLAQQSGLAARPGYTSPGSLTLDASGPASMFMLLFVSGGTVNIDLGAFGKLRVDPTLGFIVVGAPLPASPLVPKVAVGLPVPGGLSGARLHWQALLIEATQLNTLSNLVTTKFP